jgi:hypothetical protein
MRIELIDAAILPDLLRGKRCLHAKGFSECLGTAPPACLIAALRDADILVFDGDDFAADSFTSALVAVGAGSSSAPTLLAFKCADDLDRFDASWSRCATDGVVHVCPVSPDACDEPRVWDPEVARAWRASRDGGPPVVDSANRGLELDVATLKPSQRRYVGLGIVAVELTRSAVLEAGGCIAVAAWGGGTVPAAEFLLQDALFGGAPGGMPPWRYWHAARPRPGGAVEEGRLRGVSHCMLTEVDPEVKKGA